LFSSSIPDAVVFKAGFNRLNLHYEVVQKPDGDVTAELARLIKTRGAGIRAAFYHADMDSSRRTAVHEKWVSGKYNVIVATVAFAVCILYFRLSDVFRQSTMVCTERTGIRNLYAMVRYATTPGVCRRRHLADHFEEPWSSELCPKACDVCACSSEVTNIDISAIVRAMLKTIREDYSLFFFRMTLPELYRFLNDSSDGFHNTFLRELIASFLGELLLLITISLFGASIYCLVCYCFVALFSTT
ncbi:hypothetical protein COOONC_16131, partial [Cooperia oncophora]